MLSGRVTCQGRNEPFRVVSILFYYFLVFRLFEQCVFFFFLTDKLRLYFYPGKNTVQ